MSKPRSHRSPIADAGFNRSVSPVFKTPDEIRRGSPLLLDMTTDARYLYDRPIDPTDELHLKPRVVDNS